MNTAMSERLMVKTVNPISSAPRSSHGLHAVLQVTGDVFHHHDGVVHHEAGGDGQRHEREIVQAVAQQVHHRERAYQRDRHGHGGNEDGAAVAQEDEHHDDDQADGDEQRPLHVAHRGADGGGAVQHDGGVDAERDGGLDDGELLDDAVDGVDDVGAGLAEDDDGNGPLVVQVAGHPEVLDGVGHFSHVGQAHRRAVVHADDEWFVVIRAGDLVIGQDVRSH
jgi:hypothetical protein